jgi:hypothetical protein
LIGTQNIPGRPVLGGALEAARPEIEAMLGKIAAAVASGNLAELRELLHFLKHMAHEVKEIVEPEDDKNDVKERR